jgi:V/A-type H+-transporting ATPase subunit G/H
MKTEVLKSIKEAEEAYKETVAAAVEKKRRSISDAELEADNLIAKANLDAEEYRKTRLVQARQEADVQYKAIAQEGHRRAAEMKNEAGSKKEKAVELLVGRFKEQINVSG